MTMNNKIEENILNDEMLEKVIGGMVKTDGNLNKGIQTGMPCPKCSGFIPVSIEQILYTKSSITCPKCGLKMPIKKDGDFTFLKKYVNE